MDDRHSVGGVDILAEERHDLVAVPVAGGGVRPIDQGRQLGGEMGGRLQHYPVVETWVRRTRRSVRSCRCCPSRDWCGT
jgi:hypothetical protein